MKAMVYADLRCFFRSIKTYLFVMTVVILAPVIADVASNEPIEDVTEALQLGATLTVPLLVALLTMISLFTVDEAGDWASVRLMMPLTKRTVVRGRYASVLGISLASIAAGSAIGLVMGAVIGLVTGAGIVVVPAGELIATAVLALSLLLVIISIEMPVAFKFGVEKMRLVFLIPFVASFAVMVPAVRDAFSAVGAWAFGMFQTLGAVPSLALLLVASFAIYVASMRLSEVLYLQREG